MSQTLTASRRAMLALAAGARWSAPPAPNRSPGMGPANSASASRRPARYWWPGRTATSNAPSEQQGIGVKWVEFTYGPPLLEALNVGSIDFGAVGDAPPIFAQAARARLLYVAATPSRGASQAHPGAGDLAPEVGGGPQGQAARLRPRVVRA